MNDAPCWPHGQAIPPLAPVHLAAYLAKLTRNAALNRYRAQNAQKRGSNRRRLARRAGGVPAGRRNPADRAEAEVLRSALSPPFCARFRSVSGRSFWRGIFTPCR